MRGNNFYPIMHCYFTKGKKGNSKLKKANKYIFETVYAIHTNRTWQFLTASQLI